MLKVEIWTLKHLLWSLIRPLLRRSKFCVSDHPILNAISNPGKPASLVNTPSIALTVNLIASDYPSLKGFSTLWNTLWRILRVIVRPLESMHRTIQLHRSFSTASCILSELIWRLASVSPSRGGRIIRSHSVFSVSAFLTWIWLYLRFFLLPSVSLSSIACLELNLSKCA